VTFDFQKIKMSEFLTQKSKKKSFRRFLASPFFFIYE